MKVKTVLVLTALVAVGAPVAQAATVVFSDNFNSYTDGNLVGQGGWVQLGTNATTPVQVSGQKVVNLTQNQDVAKQFATSVSRTAGEGTQALTAEFDFSISAAGNDDFFFHISTGPTDTNNFYNRFYSQAGTAAGTFQMALASSAPNGGVVNLHYGGDLNLNQTYHAKSTWLFLPGAANDLFSLQIDGNAAYIAPFVWDSASSEPSTLNAANLRQAAGNAPTVATLDNIVVTLLVPEASSLTLAGLALGGVAARRRRGVC